MTKLLTSKLSVISSRPERVTFTICTLKSAYVILLFFLVGLTTSPAQTFTSLLSFDGTNGAFPQGALVEDGHGKFYGTTPYGGVYGVGTVFEVTSKGKLTTLHSFDRTDGGAPFSSLIRARMGNLYGVTSGEGLGLSGTVFEITPEGKLTTLYTFCSQPNCADGKTPYAGLVQGRNGNFYGTTYAGGANGHGTIFEITPEGKLTTLYNFCSQSNCTDGEEPLMNGLVQGHKGNFYGTTPLGGVYGSGTVYEITPRGELRTLYSFCSKTNCSDGSNPYAGLVEGRNGNFYGTTVAGGADGIGGTVFEITPEGKLTTLHSFCSRTSCPNGGAPNAGLLQGSEGNFYGTAYTGGSSGYGGAVFEITPKGKLTTLYSFCAQPGCVDGRYPVAGLMQSNTGKFYGTTFAGGVYGGNDCGFYLNYGCGTVFKLVVEPDHRTSAEPIGTDNTP